MEDSAKIQKSAKDLEKFNKTEKSESNSNYVWDIWNLKSPVNIPGTQWTIKGYSIAALRTNFYIKELEIMLDGGLSSPYCMSHIFITHGHSDHTANLPFHIYNKKENTKIKVFAPKEIALNVRNFIETTYILSSDVDFAGLNIKNEDLYLYKYYDLIPVSPGDYLEMTLKNKNYTIEIIKCHHSVPCVGYGIIEKRQKLKDEYKTLTGKEIGELRKKGKNLYNQVEYPYLCYLGDTSKEIFKESSIKKYQTIMIECTFIYDDDLGQADKTFHLHWKYLEEYIRDNPDKTFILYHFSQRYSTKELNEFFEKLQFRNVIPWIN